jgi:hypothetical protein
MHYCKQNELDLYGSITYLIYQLKHIIANNGTPQNL